MESLTQPRGPLEAPGVERRSCQRLSDDRIVEGKVDEGQAVPGQGGGEEDLAVSAHDDAAVSTKAHDCKRTADETIEASPSDDLSMSSAASVKQTTDSEEEIPSSTSPSTSNIPSEYPTIALRHNRRPGQHYTPSRQTKYLNNLMPVVGLLELTNALDFPANVWNMTPVPTFAKALMITGGVVSILASFLAFRDLHKSVTNFRSLKRERIHLLQEKSKYEEAGDLRRTNMIQAWLDLNFREALWEAAERMLMDSLNGFAGVLVGIGTILAIDGANPVSFDASNLLSGYLGNSFNVVYGAANTAFAIYMFIRSRSHSKEVSQALPAGPLRRRVLGYMKKHQVYAVVNGVTVFVSAIGSMVSAKHWQGYVVLVPCVIGAVFCNFFWRHFVGYNRDLCQVRPDAADLDAREQLEFSIHAMELCESHEVDRLLEKKSGVEVTRFMATHGMLEDFTARVLHDLGDERQKVIARRHKRHVEIEYDRLSSIDENLLIRSASKVLSERGYYRFRDEERMLSELWGAQLAQPTARRGSSQVGEQRPTKEEG